MTETQIAYYRQWVDLETRGEAIFRTHGRRAQDADQRAKWLLLAELERTTKEALLDCLRANGIEVEENPDKRREGERFAEQLASAGWFDLMADMRPRILSYVDELRAIAAEASVQQGALASRLFEHEDALLTFVDRELAGDPRTSIEPIRAHLDKWRGRDREPAGNVRPLAS